MHVKELVPKVKGLAVKAGGVHAAAQAADDSGRGRGAAVRAAHDDRRRAGLPERGRPRTRCAAAQAVHQSRRQAANRDGRNRHNGNGFKAKATQHEGGHDDDASNDDWWDWDKARGQASKSWSTG